MAQSSPRWLFRPWCILISIVMGFFLLLFVILHFDLIPKLDLDSEIVNLNVKQAHHNSDAIDQLKKVASRFVKNGEPEKAIPVLKEIHQLQTDTIGPKNKDTIETLRLLAGQNVLAEKYDEALDLYWQLYKIKEKTLGPTHLETLDALKMLARVYHYKGKYEKAVAFLKVVYRERKIQLGAEDLKTAEALMLLGFALWDAEPDNIQTLEKVLSYFQQVHKIYTHILGENNEKTLNKLVLIGKLLKKLKRYEEAISTFENIMKATDKTPQSELYEEAENLLGLTLSQLGRTEEARQIHKTARRVKTERGKKIPEYASKIRDHSKFTPEVEDQIVAVLNLAKVAMAEENYEKALKKLEQLYDIVENDHPKRKDVLQSLMEVHGALGNYKKAFDLSTELFHVVQNHYKVGNLEYYDRIVHAWEIVSRFYSKVSKEHPNEDEEQLFGGRFNEISCIVVNTMEPEVKKGDEQNPALLKVWVIAASFCGKSEIVLSTAPKVLDILERELERDVEPKREMKKIQEEIDLFEEILEQQFEESSEREGKYEIPYHMFQDEL